MGNVPVISATDVSIARGTTTVLEGVTLEVPEGAVVAVVGPNGAGKSTIAAAIAGRLRPRSGTLRVLDCDLRHGDIRHFRGRVGYFADDLAAQLAQGTRAREAVALGPYAGLRSAWFALSDAELADAERMLATVGLPDVGDRPLEDLSAGQRQRVLLARAFAGSPEIIVLDEPTSHLDLIGREEALWALEELLERPPRPRAALIVTHHVEELPSQVSHVLLVGRGNTYFGTRAIFDDTNVLAEVFGRPVTVVEVDGRLLARVDRYAMRSRSLR